VKSGFFQLARNPYLAEETGTDLFNHLFNQSFTLYRPHNRGLSPISYVVEIFAPLLYLVKYR
jgi:hypothetical protein